VKGKERLLQLATCHNWTRRIFNDQLTHLFTDCVNRVE
jgi:hypothetical protein